MDTHPEHAPLLSLAGGIIGAVLGHLVEHLGRPTAEALLSQFNAAFFDGVERTMRAPAARRAISTLASIADPPLRRR